MTTAIVAGLICKFSKKLFRFLNNGFSAWLPDRVAKAAFFAVVSGSLVSTIVVWFYVKGERAGSGPFVDEAKDMVPIPAGYFSMGSGYSVDEWEHHRVWLDAFYIDKTEVTNEEYAEFLTWITRTQDHTACHPLEGPNKDHTPKYWTDPRWNQPAYPVVGVDWFDAFSYVAWKRKRLPTEAEWEKAARGGLEREKYPWGSGDPGGRANYFGADIGRTSLPGRYPPNGYGLFDMAGNVWEWCGDWYHNEYYLNSLTTNPKGPLEGIHRVLRGGSWSDHLDEHVLRCADRFARDPFWRSDNIGFRGVRSP